MNGIGDIFSVVVFGIKNGFVMNGPRAAWLVAVAAQPAKNRVECRGHGCREAHGQVSYQAEG